MNPAPARPAFAANVRGYLLIAGAALFWAVSGILAKFLFANRSLEPTVLVQYRLLVSFACLALALVVYAPHELRIDRRHLRYFLVYGSAGMALVQLSYFVAINEGNVSTAIFLQYLAPVLTAAYMVCWAKQPTPTGLGQNLAMAIAGSSLLLLGGGQGLSTSPLGLVAGLTSAAAMSFYTIYGARGVALYGPRTVLLYSLGAASLAVAPLAQPWNVLSWGWTATDWLFILYMAIFGTLLPFALFLAGLRSVPPVQASLTAMLEPVLATFGAWLALGEGLGIWQIAGGGLICAAVARLQLAKWRARPAGTSLGRRSPLKPSP